MDRVASLRLASIELRASIFRSLPIGVRFARVLTALSTIAGPFAQTLGSVFLLRNVQGMPDPGPRWNPKARKPADTLPRGYFEDFGRKVELTFLRKVRDPDLVEDAMMTVMTKIFLHPELIQEGSSLTSAQGFVLTSVGNAVKDAVKSQGRRREVSLHDTDEDESPSGMIELDDPGAADTFREMFFRLNMRAVKQDLAKIAPWAPGYLDMVLEGYEDIEIIGDPKKGRESLLAKRLHLPELVGPGGVPVSMGMWSKANGYKDKIKKVLNKHLQTLSRDASA